MALASLRPSVTSNSDMHFLTWRPHQERRPLRTALAEFLLYLLSLKSEWEKPGAKQRGCLASLCLSAS